MNFARGDNNSNNEPERKPADIASVHSGGWKQKKMPVVEMFLRTPYLQKPRRPTSLLRTSVESLSYQL